MLPHPQIGSYRRARFDWFGIISSPQYQGHEFGQWYKHHDPKTHDAVPEPLEEFRTNDSGLGYEEAKPGDAFVRIGIGTVKQLWLYCVVSITLLPVFLNECSIRSSGLPFTSRTVLR